MTSGIASKGRICRKPLCGPAPQPQSILFSISFTPVLWIEITRFAFERRLPVAIPLANSMSVENGVSNSLLFHDMKRLWRKYAWNEEMLCRFAPKPRDQLEDE
jgi:hypothetical protein